MHLHFAAYCERPLSQKLQVLKAGHGENKESVTKSLKIMFGAEFQFGYFKVYR